MRRVIKYKYMSKMNDYTTGKHRLPSELNESQPFRPVVLRRYADQSPMDRLALSYPS